jgi:hypothetical protein
MSAKLLRPFAGAAALSVLLVSTVVTGSARADITQHYVMNRTH